MKKIFIFALAIVMIFSLCACDANKESTPSTNPTPETTTPQDSNTTETLPDETQTPDNTTTTPPEDGLTELVFNDVVPDSVTYWHNNQWKDGVYSIIDFNIETELGNKLTAGNDMPSEVKTGDIVVGFSGTMYVYNATFSRSGGWVVDETLNGWGVRLITDSSIKDGAFTLEIPAYINDKPVVSMNDAFFGFHIENIDLIIPSTMLDISGAFVCGSTPLVGTITINGNPTKFDECFPMFAFGENEGDLVIDGQCSTDIKQQIAETCSYKTILVK
jgi:hypothetical protein